MMQMALAARLGRPDVGDMAGSMYYPGSGDGQFAYVGTSAHVTDPATDFGGLGVNAGAEFGGRLSAGMLVALMVGLAAFYLWTRSYQG